MNAFLPPQRLRDLIRSIRACKTAAEERGVINKESADIRNNFREDDTTYRCRSIAKLLYIHMLGYPAHFGQMEVMKLSISPRFTDKRIGYLGAMLLLDENREVSLLITNCLKNDLTNPNQYIVALALCTLGNICSNEMARDLAPEVEKLMNVGSPYLKKKAALCACRIVRKVPDLVENFLEVSQKLLLGEKNHGVVLSACSLVIEMCKNNQRALDKYRKQVGNIVRMLKTLVVSGYSPEHDVSGISDPFLQVHLIRLLRFLGKKDEDASDKMNDIMAQIATNTETSKNVGNAILYEAVLTIMEIKSEQGLRVVAVNILGRFLLHSDKNIRYVALNSLLQCVGTDELAIQRHRATILDCLKDPDSSILKRAMELCFALMNPTTVRGTTRELLLFMETCPPEFKGDAAAGLTATADKFSPSPKWHVETLFKVLVVGGNYIRDDSLVSSLVQKVSSHSELQPYATRALYRAVCERPNYQPLAQAACWCMGEFGQHLLESDDDQHTAISEDEVVKTIVKILETRLSSNTTRHYAMNALVKLSTRLSESVTKQMKTILGNFGTSLDVELQQRSLEYSIVFKKYDNLRNGLLEPMPPYEKNLDEDGESSENASNLIGNINTNNASEDLLTLDFSSESCEKEVKSDNLMDLLGSNVDSMTVKDDGNDSKTNDILSMLDLGDGGVKNDAGSNNLNELLGLGDNTKSNEPDLLSSLDLTGADDSGLILVNTLEDVLTVHLEYSNEEDKENVARIVSKITLLNQNLNLTNFTYQVAVPKSQQVQMLQADSNILNSNNNVINQTFRVNNPDKENLRFKFRFLWENEGEKVVKVSDSENVPDSWR